MDNCFATLLLLLCSFPAPASALPLPYSCPAPFKLLPYTFPASSPLLPSFCPALLCSALLLRCSCPDPALLLPCSFLLLACSWPAPTLLLSCSLSYPPQFGSLHHHHQHLMTNFWHGESRLCWYCYCCFGCFSRRCHRLC